MKPAYKNLGKVCLTPDGYWNRQKGYERISMVTDELTGKSYISKKDVPAGVSINNQEYWQPIGSGGYRDNNIIIISDVDNNGNIISYTLQEAINTIHAEDRRPGLILGFYGINNQEVDNKYTWYLYQFNSNTVDDWNKLSCWESIYNNVNKFKGYFPNECLLFKQFPLPTIGDFAFVGEDLEKAVIYLCIENGQWKATKVPALQFANKYKAIYSRDAGEFNVQLDEITADRAHKDGEGNVIHDTYVTRKGLKNAIIEEVTKAIWAADLPDGIVRMEHLSEAVKQFIGSLGNIVNAADDEDLMVKDNLLKFNDKSYCENTYSGYGRVFVRKNILDGVNVLEQYQLDKPNTRYIIQYFHCLDGKTIEVPDHCILDFTAGGWMRNGTLICDDTLIIAPRPEDITVKLEGTYKFFGVSEVTREEINDIYEKFENIESPFVKLTQEEYDALDEKDDTKLYAIVES